MEKKKGDTTVTEKKTEKQPEKQTEKKTEKKTEKQTEKQPEKKSEAKTPRSNEWKKYDKDLTKSIALSELKESFRLKDHEKIETALRHCKESGLEGRKEVKEAEEDYLPVIQARNRLIDAYKDLKEKMKKDSMKTKRKEIEKRKNDKEDEGKGKKNKKDKANNSDDDSDDDSDDSDDDGRYVKFRDIDSADFKVRDVKKDAKKGDTKKESNKDGAKTKSHKDGAKKGSKKNPDSDSDSDSDNDDAKKRSKKESKKDPNKDGTKKGSKKYPDSDSDSDKDDAKKVSKKESKKDSNKDGTKKVSKKYPDSDSDSDKDDAKKRSKKESKKDPNKDGAKKGSKKYSDSDSDSDEDDAKKGSKKGSKKDPKKEDVKRIETELKKIKDMGMHMDLAREVIKARSLLERYRQQELQKHKDQMKNSSTVAMDTRTVAEIRRYQNPPSALHEVIKGLLLLLGEDEGTTKDWKACQRICNPYGNDGLCRRVMMFNASKVHPEILARAKEILYDIDFDEVEMIGKGAPVSFYVWAMGAIEKSEPKESSEDKKSKNDKNHSAKSNHSSDGEGKDGKGKKKKDVKPANIKRQREIFGTDKKPSENAFFGMSGGQKKRHKSTSDLDTPRSGRSSYRDDGSAKPTGHGNKPSSHQQHDSNDPKKTEKHVTPAH